MAKRIWPKMRGHGLWIVMDGMEELGASAFSQLPNTMLSNAVLMMGVDAAERDGLARVMNLVHKGLCSKDAVVAMVVPNGNAVKLSITLESTFRLDSFLSVGGMLNMDVGQARGMVDEYGGNMVAASSQTAGILCYESRKWGNELINRYAIARVDSRLDVFVLVLVFPLGASLAAVETAWAQRWFSILE